MRSPEGYDLLIRGCRIIDGSGKNAFCGEVGVSGGRIAKVGKELGGEARQVITSPGSVICPGFIDSHTHDDFYLLFHPDGRAKAMQGVTTVIVGNCGISAAPGVPEHLEEQKGLLSLIGSGHIPGGDLEPMTFGSYLSLLEKTGVGVNVACLVGHSTIRIAAMGADNRKPEPEEMHKMRSLVRKAMDEGAFGISSGLIYPPGVYADTHELIELSREAALFNGIYATHLRSEADMVAESVAEALEIGRKSGISVVISHHKVSGRSNWGRSRVTLGMIENERSRGGLVAADQYPYAASCTFLSIILPPEIQTGGAAMLCRKLKDKTLREYARNRIYGHTDGPRWDNLIEAIGYERIVIATSPSRPDCVGMSILGIADSEGTDPLDVIFGLLSSDNGVTGAVYHSMHEDDVAAIMAKPYVMIGSDGIPAFSENDKVHPRFFGTFPRVLGHFVRQLGVLSMEQAIQKMTSLPADIYGLKTKGVIKEGMDADLVIFDPETIIDRATFENPSTPPDGIQKVIIGGVVAVDNGVMTGRSNAGVLRRG